MEQFSIFANPSGNDAALIDPTPAPRRPRVLLRDERLAKRLEEMAAKMQGQIDDKLSADRQTNTPKRMAQAMSARCDGERLQRVQTVMLALAAMHRGEGCPGNLAKFRTKKAIHEAMSAELTAVPNGFHSYHVDTGKPREGLSADELELWELLTEKTPEQKQAERILQMERDLAFSKIPGYFPTPRPVIDRMLDYAGIEAGHRVLEPSAGSGAIIEAIEDTCPDVEMVCYEVNCTLTNLLEAKGYPIRGSDFMGCDLLQDKFDRVLMNPPFEKGQDIDHVLRAWELLKPGGRLVAIMSPGPFFHSTRKAETFREFFDAAGGEAHDLDAGTFKESGTNVASKLVIIDKEA